MFLPEVAKTSLVRPYASAGTEPSRRGPVGAARKMGASFLRDGMRVEAFMFTQPIDQKPEEPKEINR